MDSSTETISENATAARIRTRTVPTFPARLKLKSLLLCALFCAFEISRANSGQEIPSNGELKSETFLSDVFQITSIHKSMTGPRAKMTVKLLENEEPQVVWITGYSAEVVDPSGYKPKSQEFLCHSNLDIDMGRHREYFKWKKNGSNRLFTISQGQSSIQFPAGFGIPIHTAFPIHIDTQVLNLSRKNIRESVRHKITVQYVRNSDLTTPNRALFLKAANGLVLLHGKDGYFNVESPTKKIHGPGCSVGEKAQNGRTLRDRFGRSFSGHWNVRPGRHEYRTLVTNWMRLPFDTTAHYIAVHLHPFAESLELYDLTDQKSVYKSEAVNTTKRIGISAVDYYSSTEGLPLYKDHEYELIATYNNTSSETQDSMAVMFLYVLDKEYRADE